MRLLCVAGLMLAAGAAGAQSATGGTPWDYSGNHGPLVWGKLDPAYKMCSDGHQQSPINIHGARLNKGLKPIDFHYVGGTVTVENDGHGIVVWVKPGSYMETGGVRYELKSFAFHHPSQHAFDGKLMDMDVELMHESADGKKAIVEVRFAQERGTPNATMATLWANLPLRAGEKKQTTQFVNAGGFLPADPGYWTYMGSLPTPPCTEGVRWFVFEQELSMSLNQLRQFESVFRMNSRPLQDLHGRRIEANE
ncbi:MAG TPA: carbonic anhydrase family protein [Phycisphaerae bacterium]|nr:carbonic anhydrase family protein [Phycisphaerae bacterium]